MPGPPQPPLPSATAEDVTFHKDIIDVTSLQEEVTQSVEPHPSKLFQPIQRPLQADAKHVAILIWSRDLESFRHSCGFPNQVTHTSMRSQYPSTAF